MANTGSRYIIDEKQIGERLGRELVHPIRVFALESMGVDVDNFLKFMLPVFSTLHMDPYDAKRNKVQMLKEIFPDQKERLDHFLVDYYTGDVDLEEVFDLLAHLSNQDRFAFDSIGMTARRKRSITKFELTLGDEEGWDLERQPADEFRQEVGEGDVRSLVRRFRETPNFAIGHPEMLKVIYGVADMVREVRPHATKLMMNMHLMFIYADAVMEGDNSPEGRHRDGADYIVSALVIERAGIIGGKSTVYDNDGETELFEHTLEVGEGLFQDDRHYVHYVSPIRDDPKAPPSYGNRSIIGLDINVLEES